MGASNVGKSSLLNALWGRQGLAHTSKKPGKTSELNFFRVDDHFYCVDLPGYGYAVASAKKRALWAKMVPTYLENREALVHVFLLVDGRHPVKPGDLEALKWLEHLDVPFTLVLTKSDKAGQQGCQAQGEAWRALVGKAVSIVPFSIKQGVAIKALRQHVARALIGSTS